MKAALVLLPILTLFASPAFAQDVYCNAEILEWQSLCLDTIGGDTCVIRDICIVPDVVFVDAVIKNAAVEVPVDTPDGYREQIFILP